MIRCGAPFTKLADFAPEHTTIGEQDGGKRFVPRGGSFFRFHRQSRLPGLETCGRPGGAETPSPRLLVRGNTVLVRRLLDDRICASGGISALGHGTPGPSPQYAVVSQVSPAEPPVYRPDQPRRSHSLFAWYGD